MSDKIHLPAGVEPDQLKRLFHKIDELVTFMEQNDISFVAWYFILVIETHLAHDQLIKAGVEGKFVSHVADLAIQYKNTVSEALKKGSK